MARTSFSGPVASAAGFEGDITGTATAVSGPVDATTITASGAVILDLPTSDPQVDGQLWNDQGTVKVSAG